MILNCHCTMVCLKNYEIMSNFVKVMPRNTVDFFSGHSVYLMALVIITNFVNYSVTCC